LRMGEMFQAEFTCRRDGEPFERDDGVIPQLLADSSIETESRKWTLELTLII
jgi:uncharacterized protein YbaR (Trm112 family)